MNDGMPLLDVLRRKEPSRRPIWFMRQAGRFLSEYREVRGKCASFFDLCYSPKLACEVTLQPLRRFDLDAAILFSDIFVVPDAMGVKISILENEGPRLEKIDSQERVAMLNDIAGSSKVSAVCETIALIREQLGKDKALIGFCGGPWTLACYLIEGKSSDWTQARRVAYENPPWFVQLMERLICQSIDYVSLQIEAGVQVIQLFESWAGGLPACLRKRLVDGPLARIVACLKARYPHIPIIVFARGVGIGQADLAAQCNIDALGLDWEMDLEWAVKNLLPYTVLQGNLDPVALLCGEVVVREQAAYIAKSIPARSHIFNLGHGIRPETDPEMVQVAIETVRQFDACNGMS